MGDPYNPGGAAGNGGSPPAGSSAGSSATPGSSGSRANGGTGTGGDSTLAGGGAGGGGSSGIAGGSGGTTGGGGSGGIAGGGMIDATGGASSGPSSGRLTARPAGSVTGTASGFWEYVPPHYGNGADYPIILFFHGLGENGNGALGANGLDKLTKHGPPKIQKASEWPESRPFIVLSPQQADGCPTSQQVNSFITFALANYDVDLKRVYLTGLSCGGNGTWAYLGDHTNEVVAAAVPICGVGGAAFQKAGCAMGKVPIWSFVGDADNQGNVTGSTAPITGLMACTNPPAVDVKLKVYPGVGHEVWPPVYAVTDPAVDIYAWMLSHPKP